LAGSAAEILEFLVRKKEMSGALEERSKIVASLQRPTPKMSDMNAWLNVPYNKAKHPRKRQKARWRKFSYRVEATDRIELAISNLRRLSTGFTESAAVMQFLERRIGRGSS
jgi:hypothetical protein